MRIRKVVTRTVTGVLSYLELDPKPLRHQSSDRREGIRIRDDFIGCIWVGVNDEINVCAHTTRGQNVGQWGKDT
jgi:hypothetical protein